jgi:hypothetical protein
VTARRPELVTAVAAIVLVVDSFLPWFVVRWSSMRYSAGEMTAHANTASAGAASTGWSAGIVLALAAAAGWLLWPRRLPRRGRVAVTAVVALAGAVTTVGTWLAVGKEPDGGDGATYTFVATKAGGPRLGDIVRDVLTSGTVGWGYHLGVLLMLIIATCAFAVGDRDTHACASGGTAS